MKTNTNYWAILLSLLTISVESTLCQTTDEQITGVNKLQNGGFELGMPTDFGSVIGWDVFGNIGSLPVGFSRTESGFFPSYTPSEGSRMLIFSAGNNDFGGSVSQLFQTEPGARYLVKLKFGIVTEAIGRQQILQIAVSNNEDEFILSHLEVINSPAAGTTWKEYSAFFVATGLQTRITLSDISEIIPFRVSYNTDLIIDNVSIYKSIYDPNLNKYEKWLGEYKATGKITDDFDKDNIANGIEYVIGSNPAITNGSSSIPKSYISFSDPDGDGIKSKYIVFKYRKSKRFLDDKNFYEYIQWRETKYDVWKSVEKNDGVVKKIIKSKYNKNIDIVSVYIPRTIANSGNVSLRLRIAAKK